MIDRSFWDGKKVFLTGHTGFKGGWLSIWLHSMGAVVKGYSLNPLTTPSLYKEANVMDLIESDIGDIRDQQKLEKSAIPFNPDIFIHMAAQPLVRASYIDPIETYETNVIGTVKVFEVARKCKNLKCIVNVTTDKCYENKEWFWGYRENEPMGGHDPYSSSKGCAELVTSSYRKSFFQSLGIGLASVRAGNVIGGGDWAEDRLVPDILRAFQNNLPVRIRNPHSTRPWQHVLEPLSGYLLLAQELYEAPDRYAEGWNFGPNEDDVKPVKWILEKMVNAWPGSKWEIDQSNHPHEAGYLKLDISKAKTKLNWHPTWELELSLQKIIEWHRAWLRRENMVDICLDEINNYLRDMQNAVN